mmetsp:Transcript_114322/g.221946  ORF Transcript_114322/g.221946 Transcript_114322/m.221946 type:complete len:210 (-) Transcript_114322:171-800(-)
MDTIPLNRWPMIINGLRAIEATRLRETHCGCIHAHQVAYVCCCLRSTLCCLMEHPSKHQTKGCNKYTVAVCLGAHPNLPKAHCPRNHGFLRCQKLRYSHRGGSQRWTYLFFAACWQPGCLCIDAITRVPHRGPHMGSVNSPLSLSHILPCCYKKLTANPTFLPQWMHVQLHHLPKALLCNTWPITHKAAQLWLQAPSSETLEARMQFCC